MRIIDWFCGIGGFSLGFTRAGMRVVGACEIDPFARAVYQKHFNPGWFPNDITKIEPGDIPQADLWCGGFPCQDISRAGNWGGAGFSGARSGLWRAWVKLLCNAPPGRRPRWLVIENVAALLTDGWIADVLGDLSSCGYDAEWQIISAQSVGAPHVRERCWIIAYPQNIRCHVPDDFKIWIDRQSFEEARRRIHQANISIDSAIRWIEDGRNDLTLDGVPGFVDCRQRIQSCGLVPQIPEWIGRRIMEADNDLAR